LRAKAAIQGRAAVFLAESCSITSSSNNKLLIRGKMIKQLGKGGENGTTLRAEDIILRRSDWTKGRRLGENRGLHDDRNVARIRGKDQQRPGLTKRMKENEGTRWDSGSG